jgi:hypothetical protein
MMLRSGRERVQGVRLFPVPVFRDAHRRDVMPQVLVKDDPGSREINDSPVRKAFGGHVICSTATLRRATSGRGSPVKTIT